MTVHSLLRVEHAKDHDGPFGQGRGRACVLDAYPDVGQDLPCPIDERANCFWWCCATRSFAELRRWFPPNVQGWLRTHGYHVRRVFALRVEYLGAQVVYDPESVIDTMHPGISHAR